MSLLAAGASLGEIGQLLRHRRPGTTALYAKVDLSRCPPGTALAGETAMIRLAPHRGLSGLRRAWASSWSATAPRADFAAFLEAAARPRSPTLSPSGGLPRRRARPAWAAQRLGIVRGFARSLQSVDPPTQVPLPGACAGTDQSATPYVYIDPEVTALLTAALPLRPPLRG